MQTDLNIIHDREKSRFYCTIEDMEAEMTYRKVDKNTLNYNHTYVPEELRGKNIAGKLVKTALEYARDRGLKVIPTCSFVISYLKKHPEYDSLIKQNS